MPEAGWYEDSGQPGLLRWWDGARWTTDTVPAPGSGVSPGPGPLVPGPQLSGRDAPDPISTVPPPGPNRVPLVLGVVAAVVVIAVVVTTLVSSGGHHTGPTAAPATSAVTAPNVPTTRPPARTTVTTVPGAGGEFVGAVETGEHAVHGYGGHGSTLLGFGRSACAVLKRGAPAVVAWYGAVAPNRTGTTPIPPIDGAYFTATAARYLCPAPELVTHTDRLAKRVGDLPAALTAAGLPASVGETAAGVAAYACDLFATHSSATRVLTDLRGAVGSGRYAVHGTEAGTVAAVGIKTVCPGHFRAWTSTTRGRTV